MCTDVLLLNFLKKLLISNYTSPYYGKLHLLFITPKAILSAQFLLDIFRIVLIDLLYMLLGLGWLRIVLIWYQIRHI